jgi:hypothetical protein
MAKVVTSPNPRLDRSASGPNLLLDWRIPISVASGAMPLNPVGSVRSGAAAMIPATTVPCPSQSCLPSPLET